MEKWIVGVSPLCDASSVGNEEMQYIHILCMHALSFPLPSLQQ